jgi:SSS family solute:Na+ symporter
MSGLGYIDLAIVAIYLAAMISIGFLSRRLASRGVDAYFLGDRRMRWWMLAASGSSSYWDITGTMWIVSLLCVLGMKAMWHQWIWGFPLPVFFAAFMGRWINRSRVLTAAEWMKTRFGEDAAGQSARSAYAALAVVTVVSFLAYDAVGMGKFGEQYLPFSRHVCAALILGLTGIYIVFGGFRSLVITELVQTVIMSFGAVTIAYLGFRRADLAALGEKLSGSWFSLSIGWKDPNFLETEFFLFGALTIAWVSKGLLLSFGGPEQLYDFQRFLSARDERDASKLGALWGVLHTLRWPMAMGIAVLFLSGFMGVSDTEQVMPAVIKSFLPVGVRGLILAALLAAFMSTFNSTVNAGASYLVVDIYKKYLRPDATQKQLVRAGYVSSLLLIGMGILIGWTATSIHRVFQWIMAALGAGVLLPNFLRWYWWRLNGWGFTAGVATGIFASLIQAIFFGSAPLYIYFPIIAGLGLAASVVVSYLTPPTDEEVLIGFYRTIQPAGLWRPVKNKVKEQNPGFCKEIPFRNDLLNVILGIPWLFSLWVSTMYLVGRKYQTALIWFLTAAVLTVVLYFTWYRPMRKARPHKHGRIDNDKETELIHNEYRR